MGKGHTGKLAPFVCFKCRKSFKRLQHPRIYDRTVPPDDPEVFRRTCPTCGGVAHWMDQKFKPPKTTDLKQWQKVRYLFDHGFRFTSVGHHGLGYVGYPRTLVEAKQFVAHFKALRAQRDRDKREEAILRKAKPPRIKKR